MSVLDTRVTQWRTNLQSRKLGVSIGTDIKSMKLEVKVRPNSNRREAEFRNDRLKVWVKAEPERGKANSELISFLREKIKKETGANPELQITRGSKSRRKIIEIKGIPSEFQNLEDIRKAFD